MKRAPRIPGYDLVQPLGGGPFARVWSAHDAETDSLVALKLLRDDSPYGDAALTLLRREARIRVAHPHLVHIRTDHTHEPPYYLTMDLLRGEPLRSALRRRYRLRPATALWIVRQIAEALAALHRAGFVHGDVKPDNVRILSEGNAMLLDLGFAHRPGENASLFEEGYVLGTANYLAPELSGPSPGDGFASDVFSLGVSLFEMLTGQLPYRAGTNAQTIRRHAAEPPADIRDHGLSLPAGVAELLHRLMARTPQERPLAARVVQQLIALEIAALKRRKAA